MMITQDMTQAQAMMFLRLRGVAKVVVHFSGGNDEGGADTVEFLAADGSEVPVPESNAYRTSKWNNKTRAYEDLGYIVGSWVDGKYSHRPATDEEIQLARVRTVLEQPIYDSYGSFAGDFHVEGKVVWDVARGTYKMGGQQSYEHYASFGDLDED